LKRKEKKYKREEERGREKEKKKKKDFFFCQSNLVSFSTFQSNCYFLLLEFLGGKVRSKNSNEEREDNNQDEKGGREVKNKGQFRKQVDLEG